MWELGVRAVIAFFEPVWHLVKTISTYTMGMLVNETRERTKWSNCSRVVLKFLHVGLSS